MTTYLNQLNSRYVDELRKTYETDPTQVEPTWRAFFDGMAFVNGAKELSAEGVSFEFRVLKFIQAHRELGHLVADVDPLDRRPRVHPLLELSTYGLSEADLNQPTEIAALLGLPGERLSDILEHLRTAYCSPIAVEIEHIGDPETRQWIEKRIESHAHLAPFDAETKKVILKRLLETEVLENFIHKRFVGQKRFSAEGNDAIVPMIDELIQVAEKAGTHEMIMGMAHRGRLSLLATVFRKDLKAIFAEFSGNLETANIPGDGDVKYHLGFSGDVSTRNHGKMHLSLISNPSHLEATNPVVMGITRAKQKMGGDEAQRGTLAVLLHGDASFSGQGSIYEVLNMSELRGYTVGGTVHIIINNQIGFTTTPEDGRSTPNATDVAKMLEAPIFRVNADEPELAVRAIHFALEYRNAFGRDVFIDLMGYRRYGHNEGDEPAFTQPVLYNRIKKHPRVAKQYGERLVAERVLSSHELEQLRKELEERCENVLEESKKAKVPRETTQFEGAWRDFEPVPQDESFFAPLTSGVEKKKLIAIGKKLNALPETFHAHPKILRFFEERNEMFEEKRELDWGMAEALAYATLLDDGYLVRLAGQDSERGTFSHRHSVLHDVETGERYIPLNHIDANAGYEVVNSLLSEFAALGFEFGQSLANPEKLTLWEAQFGDFVNGAQVLLDQFLVSSAQKWQRHSGLTLLLPHGYEGMGPEHSSARPERFLQACAQHNIQVCNATTPAQFFHLLRRQMLRQFRLPLIVLTPKSLLRHRHATSSLDELATGKFEEMLDDPEATSFHKAKRVIFTSGKVYYDLLQMREEKQLSAALLRIEQYYPFHEKRLRELLKTYTKMKQCVWVQEEPQNMGAWSFLRDRLQACLDQKVELQYVGRPAQANVSGGYAHVHEREQQQMVKTALEG